MTDTDHTTLTPEDADRLRNIAAIGAIRDGIDERIHDIAVKVSRGHLRNTARTRGYVEALQDLRRTLTSVLTKTEVTPDGS